MVDNGIDNRIDRISNMKIYLKKMIPVVGIYIIINVGYSYYQFGILKNKNFEDISPVFIVSSAVYWIIMFYYNYKYTKIQKPKEEKVTNNG